MITRITDLHPEETTPIDLKAASISPQGSSPHVIKEHMIEDYVLRLQKSMNLSNERTRQLMSFFLLQFMLKNLHPYDFQVQNERIIRLDKFPASQIDRVCPMDPNRAYPEVPPPMPPRRIVVLPLEKHDLRDLDFEGIVSASSPMKILSVCRCAPTSYDMWMKYLETQRPLP